jgi:hypothetical protein
VEAQRSQRRRVTGSDEPAAQRRRVEMPRAVPPEDRVVGPRGVAPLAESHEDLCHLGDQGDGPCASALGRRHGAAGEGSLDADRALLEVDVARAQRDELTPAQARESAVRKSAASCLDAAARASA